MYLSIQVLRGIAALLVVFTHLYAYEAVFEPRPGLLPGWVQYGSSGVDLFFVISGFIMVATTGDQHGRPGATARFLLKRFLRIYPLYWVATLSLIAVYLFVPAFAASPHWQQASVLHSLLLLPQDASPVLAVGWTLVHELYFYIVFALLLIFPARFLVPGLVLWFCAIAATPFFFNLGTNPALMIGFHPLTAEFIGGCLAGYAVCRLQKTAPPSVLAAGCAMLVINWFLHWVLTGGDGFDWWTRIVMLGIPYALIVYGAASCEVRYRPAFPKAWLTLGDASYSIYLAHFPAIALASRAAAKGVQKFDLPGVQVLALCAMFVSAVAAGLVFYSLVERRLMSGARKIAKRLGEPSERVQSAQRL